MYQTPIYSIRGVCEVWEQISGELLFHSVSPDGGLSSY